MKGRHTKRCSRFTDRSVDCSILMVKASTRLRIKTANTSWNQGKMWSTKMKDTTKMIITPTTKEITTVTISTSIKQVVTSNIIRAWDRTSRVNNLESSKGEVETVEVIDLRSRIQARVVNLATSNLMTWTIATFIRMIPTFIGQSRLRLAKQIHRQHLPVECLTTTKLPSSQQLIPCTMTIRIENPRHHLRPKMPVWDRIVPRWARMDMKIITPTSASSTPTWLSPPRESLRATKEHLKVRFLRKPTRIAKNRPWASTS